MSRGRNDATCFHRRIIPGASCRLLASEASCSVFSAVTIASAESELTPTRRYVSTHLVSGQRVQWQGNDVKHEADVIHDVEFRIRRNHTRLIHVTSE